jgi:hypothetical protein
MLMEHMDRGTVQHLADKGLINLEGTWENPWLVNW